MSELSELAAHIRAEQAKLDELRARLKTLIVASGKPVRFIASECGVSVQRIYRILGGKGR